MHPLDAGTSTVGGLMSPDPILVWADTPLPDVADLLDRSGISGVPVVDWSGYLVGVVTTMDLLRVRASDSLWPDWSRLSTRHVMSQPALTVTVDTPVEHAARMIESHHIHRLVVVADDGETPIGVLSATDLVRAMAGRAVDRSP